MGKHLAVALPRHLQPTTDGRHSSRVRRRMHFVLSAPALYASVFAVVLGVIMVNAIDPSSGAVASPLYSINEATRLLNSQSIDADTAAAAAHTRDGFQTIARAEAAPAAGIPDPGSAQAIGYVLVAQRGWSTQEFSCLVSLWNRESHWNVNSHNASSGAHGIPQALPGSKMASAGPDWATNPRTQIIWGLGYISKRYGTPCQAWAHSQNTGWY